MYSTFLLGFIFAREDKNLGPNRILQNHFFRENNSRTKGDLRAWPSIFWPSSQLGITGISHKHCPSGICCCLVAKSCPNLCNLVDCSPRGSSVYGILRARIPEWVAISFSRGSSQPRDQTNTSCLEGEFFPRILSNTYSFFKANHSILGLFLLEHFLSKNPIKVYPLRLLRLNKLPNAALQTLENNAKLFVQTLRPVS